MALTAARYLDMSQAGHQLTLRAAAADTFNKGGRVRVFGRQGGLEGSRRREYPVRRVRRT